MCFTIMKTIPNDILLLLLKFNKTKQLLEAKKKTFDHSSYSEKLDKNRAIDKEFEAFENNLSSLFQKLGVNTKLDIQVLLEHVIKAGNKTEDYVNKLNEINKKRSLLSKSGGRRLSHMFESSSLASIGENGGSGSRRGSRLKQSLLVTNKFKLAAKQVISQNRILKKEELSNQDDGGDDDDIEFETLSIFEKEEYMNDKRNNIQKAYSEVGKLLLELKTSDQNKATEYETRLKNALSNSATIWLKAEELGEPDIAKKASSTFFTFDFNSKWADSRALSHNFGNRQEIDFAPLFYQLKDEIKILLDNDVKYIMKNPLFYFYSVLGSKVQPERTDLLTIINYTERKMSTNEYFYMNMLTNAVGILCAGASWSNMIELEGLKLPNTNLKFISASELVINPNPNTIYQDIDLKNVNILNYELVKEQRIFNALTTYTKPLLHSVGRSIISRLAEGATKRTYEIDISKAQHFQTFKSLLLNSRTELIGNIEVVMSMDAQESTQALQGSTIIKPMSYEKIQDCFPESIEVLEWIEQSFSLILPSGREIDVTEKLTSNSNPNQQQQAQAIRNDGIAHIENRVLYIDAELAYDISTFQMKVCESVQIAFNGKPSNTSMYKILQTILNAPNIEKVKSILDKNNIKGYANAEKPQVGEYATHAQMDQFINPISVPKNCNYMIFAPKDIAAYCQFKNGEPTMQFVLIVDDAGVGNRRQSRTSSPSSSPLSSPTSKTSLSSSSSSSRKGLGYKNGQIKVSFGKNVTKMVDITDIKPLKGTWIRWMVHRNDMIKKFKVAMNKASSMSSCSSTIKCIDDFKADGISDFRAPYLLSEYNDDEINFMTLIEQGEKKVKKYETSAKGLLLSFKDSSSNNDNNKLKPHHKFKVLLDHLMPLDAVGMSDIVNELSEEIRSVCRQEAITEDLKTESADSFKYLQSYIATMKDIYGTKPQSKFINDKALSDVKKDIKFLEEKLSVFSVTYYTTQAYELSQTLDSSSRFDAVITSLDNFLKNVDIIKSETNLKKNSLTTEQINIIKNENTKLEKYINEVIQSYEKQLQRMLKRIEKGDIDETEINFNTSLGSKLKKLELAIKKDKDNDDINNKDTTSTIKKNIKQDVYDLSDNLSNKIDTQLLIGRVTKYILECEAANKLEFIGVDTLIAMKQTMEGLTNELEQESNNNSSSPTSKLNTTTSQKNELQNGFNKFQLFYENRVSKWEKGDFEGAEFIKKADIFIEALAKAMGHKAQYSVQIVEVTKDISAFLTDYSFFQNIVKQPVQPQASALQPDANGQSNAMPFNLNNGNQNTPPPPPPPPPPPLREQIQQLQGPNGEFSTSALKQLMGGGSSVADGDGVGTNNGGGGTSSGGGSSGSGGGGGGGGSDLFSGGNSTSNSMVNKSVLPPPAVQRQMRAIQMEENKSKAVIKDTTHHINKQLEQKDEIAQKTQQKKNETFQIEQELEQIQKAGTANTTSKARVQELTSLKQKNIKETEILDVQLEESIQKLKQLEKVKQEAEAKLNALDAKTLREDEGYINELAELEDGVSKIADELILGIEALDDALKNCNLLMDTLVGGEIQIPNLFLMIPVEGNDAKSKAKRSLGTFFGLQKKFLLVFLCSYDLTPAKCGLHGKGYEIVVDTQFAKDILPAVQCTFFALKLANLASKVLLKVDVLGAVDAVASGVGSLISGAGNEAEGRLMTHQMSNQKLIEITPDSLMKDLEIWNQVDDNYSIHDDGGGQNRGNLEIQMSTEEGQVEVTRATGQAYRKLESKLLSMDPNLLKLDMCISADANHQCRWVKTSNKGAWSRSTENSRRQILKKEENIRLEKLHAKLLENPLKVGDEEGDEDINDKVSKTKSEISAMEQRIKEMEDHVNKQNQDIHIIDDHLTSQQELVDELKQKLEDEKKKLEISESLLSESSHRKEHGVLLSQEEERLIKEKEEYHKKAKELQELQLKALEKEIATLEARRKNKEDLDKKKKETLLAMAKNKDKLMQAQIKLNSVQTSVMRLMVSMQQAVSAELEIPRLFVIIPEAPPEKKKKKPSIKEPAPIQPAPVAAAAIVEEDEEEYDFSNIPSACLPFLVKKKKKQKLITKPPSAPQSSLPIVKTNKMEPPPKKTPKSYFQTHYRLVFLCAFDGSPVPCGKDGKGYLIKKDTPLLKKLRPTLHISLFLLKAIGVASGLVTSHDLNGVTKNFELPEGTRELSLFKEASKTLDAIDTDEDAATVFADQMLSKLESNKESETSSAVTEDENFEKVKSVTGRAYRELCEWVMKEDNNLHTLAMRKTRDAEGAVDWVSPKNWIAWQSSTDESRQKSRRQLVLHELISSITDSPQQEWACLDFLHALSPSITNMDEFIQYYDELKSDKERNDFIDKLFQQINNNNNNTEIINPKLKKFKQEISITHQEYILNKKTEEKLKKSRGFGMSLDRDVSSQNTNTTVSSSTGSTSDSSESPIKSSTTNVIAMRKIEEERTRSASRPPPPRVKKPPSDIDLPGDPVTGSKF
mmetsp:Transcript_10863/g.14136  ORF Transcript_10863/g.14136 Transcript_10863/m.14136 type:complete len:2482 (-) Transcript_10863:112-7557(-)